MLKKLVLLLLTLCSFSYAALPAATIFEVRQAGNDASSGCFISTASGTDYSKQNAEQYGFSDLASTSGTTNPSVVTSASHNFVAADVGNCIRISSGTNWTAGLYYIVSAAANAATLDRAVGTSATISSGVFHVGGALATLAQLNTNMCTSCQAYVKADATYTVSAAVSFNFGNSNGQASVIIGYSSTRGDNLPFTVQASAGLSSWVITMSSNQVRLYNVVIDANNQSSTRCLQMSGAESFAQNIECENVTDSGVGAIYLNREKTECRFCYVHDVASSADGFKWNNTDATCRYCTVKTMTGSAHIGFNFNSVGGYCFYCTVNTSTVANSDGFSNMGGGAITVIDHCIVYNVARDAIRVTSVRGPTLITNCIFSTLTNGINNTSGTTLRTYDIVNDYNATYNASGAAVVSITAGPHDVALSGDPFTTAGTNFTLNNTASAGAAARAVGAPATIPGSSGTGYPDIGNLQHQDSGGTTVGGFVAP